VINPPFYVFIIIIIIIYPSSSSSSSSYHICPSFTSHHQVRPIFDAISRDRFGKGIKVVACFVNPLTGNTNTLVGAGDGKLAVVNPSMNTVAGKTAEVLGSVTSLSIAPDQKGFLVSTSLANR